MALEIVIAVAVGVLATWAILVVILIVATPRDVELRAVARLVPDVLRLLRALATDRTLPRSVRLRICLLIVYLALPIDLIPDFVPVIGYADDVIITILVLRSAVRRVGNEALDRLWTGTPSGLDALRTVAGLEPRPRDTGE